MEEYTIHGTERERFHCGKIVVTMPVAMYMTDDLTFHRFVRSCLVRHVSGDWGEVSDALHEINGEYLEEREELYSFYDVPAELAVRNGLQHMPGRICISTDAPRQFTTVRFEEEFS
jgi:hypothetical protein